MTHPADPPADDRPGGERRHLLLAGAGLAAAAAAAGATAAAAQTAPPPMAGTVPLVPPRTEFVYEAVVDIAPTMPLGDSPLGERRMVPITGGSFEGPNIRGKVLPGGADRQLVRRDGVRILNALYELQAEDGAVITVHNRVLIDEPRPGGPRYAFSTLEITAPEGPHAWLNRGVFVGTLNSLRPAREAVLIRVFRVV
jgi:hypothetical protein